jgi:hypothetical protein
VYCTHGKIRVLTPLPPRRRRGKYLRRPFVGEYEKRGKIIKANETKKQ